MPEPDFRILPPVLVAEIRFVMVVLLAPVTVRRFVPRFNVDPPSVILPPDAPKVTAFPSVKTAFTVWVADPLFVIPGVAVTPVSPAALPNVNAVPEIVKALVVADAKVNALMVVNAFVIVTWALLVLL